MGFSGLKRLTFIFVVFVYLLLISVIVLSTDNCCFATETISVAGDLTYGENFSLTLNDFYEADSFYWDYYYNGNYYACSGDNGGRTYSSVADFVGQREFRCICEQSGELFFLSVTLKFSKRPIKLKLNKSEAYYGEEEELALVVDETLDKNNYGLADGDDIGLFDYSMDLSTCGIKSIEVNTVSQYYEPFCTQSFNYKRRPIVLSIEYAEYEYGDEIVPVLSVSDSTLSMGLVGGDDITLFYNSVMFQVEYGTEPLGLKYVTGRCVDANVGKYTIADIEGSKVLITSKHIDITLLDTDIQYGDDLIADFRIDGLAVMHTESKFDERAVSSAGAVGLMQLMPATAEWIARKLHMEYSYEKLFDAEYNIELGTYYLSYLLKSFEYEYALAAYNAGEGKVREWLSDGVKTDDIPYKETRDYVKRVIKKVYEIKESYYLY